MDWNSYREILGIGLNDEEKFKLAKRRVLNFVKLLQNNRFIYDEVSYYRFSNVVGCKYNDSYTLVHLEDYFNNVDDHRVLIFSLVAWANTIDLSLIPEYKRADGYLTKEFVINFVKGLVKEVNLNMEVIEDEDGVFVIPKGCSEFDIALISEPFVWLKDYPESKKQYTRILRAYENGEYTRDIADNCRKLLEQFLQEFFDNKSNLENNLKNVGTHLKEKGLSKELTNMVQTLIDYYKKYNDSNAKHNDLVPENALEYIIYQTGLFIRLLLKA